MHYPVMTERQLALRLKISLKTLRRWCLGGEGPIVSCNDERPYVAYGRVIPKQRLAMVAYVESFNGRFRDERLNEHWFISLAHARVEIEQWRREYNEERPKRSLGGLPPAAYARQLADKALTMPGRL